MKEELLEALTDAIGCLGMTLLVVAIMGVCLYTKVATLTNEVETVQKEFDQSASIEGEISKIENSTGADKIVEDRGGNITLTLKVSPDRTKIYFKDGRSKEFIGMPTKPIEIGKYYKIKYNARYNVLMDIELVLDLEAILNAPILFGLKAQGHIPTIEKMLAEGKAWEEIGKVIGWIPDTAKEYYERYNDS